jgi:CheY-like chemotaxis protein
MRDPIASDQPKRLLVVDDDQLVLRMMERALRDDGLHVTAVHCPEAALDVLRDARRHIDVLLTDIVMPKLDGVELATVARQHRPQLEVLFTSGYIEPSHQHSMPPDARLLCKPFTPDELLAFVRH